MSVVDNIVYCVGNVRESYLHLALFGLACLVLIPLSLFVLVPLYLSILSLINPHLSGVKYFPGPESVSFWFGALPTLYGKYEIPAQCSKAWIRTYGWVVKIPGWFGTSRILVNDPVAMNYVTQTRPYDYPKDEGLRAVMERIVGHGLLSVESEAHRRQRRLISPSFGQAHLRALYPVFYNTGQMVKEQWLEAIDQGEVDRDHVFPVESTREKSFSTLKPGQVFIKVNKWLAKAAMSIIGEGGFGCNFNVFSSKPNHLRKVFEINPCDDMRGGVSANVQILRELYVAWAAKLSFLSKILPFDNTIEYAKTVWHNEANRILHEKRRLLETNKEEASKEKDLMSLMLRANSGMGKNSLSDKEIEGQMSTFILAGSETTATALQWTLWRLSVCPEYQDKLRQEIWATREKNVENGQQYEFTAQDLEEMPMLDAVTREILRVDPPVTQISRIAGINDRIPLFEPVKGKDGKMYSSIPVKKGTELSFSILAYNTDKRIWGEDADEFRPERWLDEKNSPTKLQATCGVYSNTMTFWAGPRACIGYKFALMEYKTFLSILIDQFKFELRDPNMELTRMVRFVQQPFIKGEEFNGPGMPLRVSIARTD